MKLSDLSDAFGLHIEHDGAFDNLGFITHERPGLLVFIESGEYLRDLHANPNVAAVIATKELARKIETKLAIAVSDHPGDLFYSIQNYLVEKTSFYGTPVANEIAESAQISEHAVIARRGVRIGKNVRIEARAVIHTNVVLEDDVIIRAGAIIGGEGFQFRRAGSEIRGVRHAGGVWLQRGVEIQQNSCVDRGLFGTNTKIGEFTKVDNLVNISHEVTIGQRVLIGAGAMISGSVTIGDDVWIGPGSCVSSAVTIGDRGRVSLGAVVVKNVLPGQTVSGNFAVDHDQFIRFIKSIA